MDKGVIQYELRIDWSELDYFGHVNNVYFYKYIQSARVNYWDQIGLREYHLKHKIGPILAHCSCDFKKPLYFPGTLTILTHCSHIGNSSFSLEHHLLNDNNELAAQGKDVMVMYDFNKDQKVLFPNWLKENIMRVATQSN